MAFGYKDIINYSIIRKLKERMTDACIIFNNLVRKDNISDRESEYYEVYIKQYKEDLTNLQELRDRCLKIADECNEIMLKINSYHIKQYYLDPNELSEYEDQKDYISQLPTEASTEKPTEAPVIEDDDIW